MKLFKKNKEIEAEIKEEKKKEVNICPICGKPYDYALTVTIVDGKQVCRHDQPSPKSKTVTQRHANEEASVAAMRMAAEAKAMDVETGNVMVPIRSTQSGKDQGKTQMIPKKVLESIEEKVAPLLEE